MQFHFRNLEYVEPPGCLTEILAHPNGRGIRSIELSLFFEHRYAFFFWNKWTRKIVHENDYINYPPCLITLDWHQDLAWPVETERKWLDELDTNNNADVAMFAWSNLPHLNDGQIMAAAYLNLIGNIYVHCRQGTFEDNWKDQKYKDKYGNIHLVKKFKEFEKLEQHMLNSDEANVYFDIDLDFFTINNPLNSGKWKSFTYLTERKIKDMLNIERPLISWIFNRLCGFTIAVEPEHTGGLVKANRLLALLNEIYFSPPLFTNCGEHWRKSTNWKHLKRK